MRYPDPRQAIVAQLAQPGGKPLWQSAPSPGGWRRAISRGGGHDADPDTVRFVKRRGIDPFRKCRFKCVGPFAGDCHRVRVRLDPRVGYRLRPLDQKIQLRQVDHEPVAVGKPPQVQPRDEVLVRFHR